MNFPITYVKRGDRTPTAARLFRSGELRLKLHMTLAMQATRAPRTLPNRPSRSSARMLNLPSDTGARRVSDALKFLEQENLVSHAPLPDGKDGLLLLHPDGSGGTWEGDGARWVGVPFALWTNAWVICLSGRAIAVTLALLELNGGSEHPDGEFMDRHRKSQYGLSNDTWTRGSQELERFGLLRTTEVKWGDDDYEVRRRKRYLLIRQGFDSSPDWRLA